MAQRVVGIDLGTTNCAMSWHDLNDLSAEVVPIPQLTAPGTVEERPLLPSFLYMPKEDEFPAGALDTAWEKQATSAVGEFARAHGAKGRVGRIAGPRAPE